MRNDNAECRNRLLALCVIFMLLLAACGQASVGPVVSTALAEPTTAEETTSEEATTALVAPVLGDTDFTVTRHKLIPPAQVFDAEFDAFYNEFTAAVRGKDMTFIDGILDDGVMSSFGGEPGIAFFYEYWGEWKSYDELWDVLEEIIALGGVYDQAKKSFVAPYLFQAGLEAYEQFAIIAKDVPVYANASTGSQVIASLDYSVLEFHSSGEFWEKGPEDFVSVTLLLGDKGYMQKKYLRSPIDYRLRIEQKGRRVETALANRRRLDWRPRWTCVQ